MEIQRKKTKSGKDRTPPGPKPRPQQYEPEVAPADLPDRLDPPAWLDNYARDEWFTYVDELMTAGVITQRDVPAFSQLCMLLGIARRCAEIIELRAGSIRPDRKGDGDSALSHAYGTKPIPEIKLMMQAQDKAFKIMDKFGMMPGSRKKLGNSPPKGNKNGKLTATEARRVRLYGVPN